MVYSGGVFDNDEIKPSAAPFAAGRDADLLTDGLKVFAGFLEVVLARDGTRG